MDVQPVTGASRGPGSRIRAVAAVSAPAFVLVATVALGALGPRGGGPVTEPAATRPPATQAPRDATRLSTPSVPNVFAAGLLASARDDAFPRRGIGLPVWTVEGTLELHRSGALKYRLVAIGGWLLFPGRSASCLDDPDDPDDPAPSEDLCLRLGLVADDVDADGSGALGAALGVRFPAGVSLAPIRALVSSAADDGGSVAAAADGSRAIRAVLLGGFGDPRQSGCAPRDAMCNAGFVVERLLWVDGRWLGRPIVAAADIEDLPTTESLATNIAQSTLRKSPTVLGSVLVTRDLLAVIDPFADRAVSSAATGPIWYLRVMPERLNMDIRGRDVRWIVIDVETGSVLASHPALSPVVGAMNPWRVAAGA